MGASDFDGKSVSIEHIGSDRNDVLAGLLNPDTKTVKLALSLGAEAADVRRLAIQAVDAGGNALRTAARLQVELFDDKMVAALVAAASLSEVSGFGTFISTDVQPAALLNMTSDGTALIDVTDESGALVGDLYCKVSVVGSRGGFSQLIAVTFA